MNCMIFCILMHYQRLNQLCESPSDMITANYFILGSFGVNWLWLLLNFGAIHQLLLNRVFLSNKHSKCLSPGNRFSTACSPSSYIPMQIAVDIAIGILLSVGLHPRTRANDWNYRWLTTGMPQLHVVLAQLLPLFYYWRRHKHSGFRQ